ncbi:MAG: outer membrane beta-barrel protein [Bacteroidota bacterium]
MPSSLHRSRACCARLLGLLLVSALLVPAAAAQFRVGIVGGVNASAFDATAGAEIDGSAGAHLGLFVDVGDAPIALRVGATYVSAGTIAAVPLQTEIQPDPRQPSLAVVIGDTLASGFDVTFLALPIELHYRFEAPRTEPYIAIGPELRIPLGDQGADIEEAVLGTAVAFSLAGGVLFPLGSRSKVFGEIRYVADVSGFTDEARIDPDGPAGPFPEVTVESYQINLFSLRVGLLF